MKAIFKYPVIFLSALMLSISFISCENEEINDENSGASTASFTMTYDGVTYTDVLENSLVLTNGTIAVIGEEGNEFSLMIIGVGADGTTVSILPGTTSVLLDFGAVVGKEGLAASSGTVTRSGNTIEIDVMGTTTSLVEKTLTATIVVGQVISL